MEFNNGYIKLYRSLLDWEWWGSVKTRDVFIYLLLAANWEDKRWQGIWIRRGQFLTSRAELAKAVGITEGATREALKRLKSTNEITIDTTNQRSLITIVNYEKYQGCDTKTTNETTNNSTNEQPTDNQRTTTTKEYKESAELEEVKKRVLCAWNGLASYGIAQVTSLNHGTKRYQMFNARLKQYGEEKILTAIENIKNSSFLQGGGSKGWTITFDWFVKPDNFVKVLEGNYTDIKRQGNNSLQQLLADIEGGKYDE